MIAVIYPLNIVLIICVNYAVKTCSLETHVTYTIISNNLADISWKNCTISKKLKTSIRLKHWDYIVENLWENIH